LQPDQRAAERLGQDFGDLGLADAGLAFQEQRPLHAKRKEQHRRQRTVGNIITAFQKRDSFINGRRKRLCNGHKGVSSRSSERVIATIVVDERRQVSRRPDGCHLAK
jgi:hypothetical protein